MPVEYVVLKGRHKKISWPSTNNSGHESRINSIDPGKLNETESTESEIESIALHISA